MMRRLAHLRRDQRGAAAAEMALILPLALALLFTMFEGAYYMICEHRVVKSVRDAARYAARLDLSNYACPGGGSSLPQPYDGYVRDLTRFGKLMPKPDDKPLVVGWINSDVTIAVTCASGQGGIYASSGGYAPRITVTSRVTYPSLMSTLGFTASTTYIAATAQSPVVGL